MVFSQKNPFLKNQREVESKPQKTQENQWDFEIGKPLEKGKIRSSSSGRESPSRPQISLQKWPCDCLEHVDVAGDSTEDDEERGFRL
ncbi:hypothetical protein C1H46_016084 [Malus baccata]|uniref:Uncharacterized protein n=1 Tax=Malus baccata TaxID=106549 RepID=A0A540MHR4_MALBA|nr:hypothetical protein C1H46_016084 [Malus baccata]